MRRTLDAARPTNTLLALDGVENDHRDGEGDQAQQLGGGDYADEPAGEFSGGRCRRHQDPLRELHKPLDAARDSSMQTADALPRERAEINF